MKGLILNDIYTIQKSIKTSVIITVVSVIALILTKNSWAFRAAVFLPFLIIPVQSFEVFKHETKSGWDKFLITLPVKREHIVQSKYITFLILLSVSLLLSVLLFFLIDTLLYPTFNITYFNHLLNGMGLIICMAALLFPMTYKLGTEKSDSIALCSLGFSIGIYYSLAIVSEMILADNHNADTIFSIVFFSLSVFLMMISFFISCFIVKQKEY